MLQDDTMDTYMFNIIRNNETPIDKITNMKYSIPNYIAYPKATSTSIQYTAFIFHLKKCDVMLLYNRDMGGQVQDQFFAELN